MVIYRKVMSFFFILLLLSLSSLVYNRCGYIEIVQERAVKSMKAAVDEVKALPEYATSGEVNRVCTKWM
jgi:hypothetical protein